MNPSNYEDIINLPHHTSTKHARMSRADRAAQFAPFAALTGHDEAIKSVAKARSETDIEINISMNEYEEDEIYE